MKPTIYLRDYQPYPFEVPEVSLVVSLFDTHTDVTTTLTVVRKAQTASDAPLVLAGTGFELLQLSWNGVALDPAEVVRSDECWFVPAPGAQGVLRSTVRLAPDQNLALEGLYRSQGLFCTQCEPEGFRRITLHPDRPDVLSRYHVRIEADQAQCPVLLSNGNCVKQEVLPHGRHAAEWTDPYPKPSYLFALVAGDLACLEDTFVTAEGRSVRLALYTEPQDQDKCGHAMSALKAAMAWDEQQYGRCYDLDVYMIVAVSHFNMGAMENKGLNIFNTSCVLAHPDTTTDAGFQRVESVVAHEYFHNWSGNRVTCRDWFQLCLKEGFTVFRDQQFSGDQLSPAVQRLEDVAYLTAHQFAEDAGPLSHPVRPESFVEINNFYTLTVYEKGAEIARLLHTVLGAAAFRRGCDRYFADFDGQAVTVEDFLGSFQRALSLPESWVSLWLRWYQQAGTPTVTVHSDWSAAQGRLTVTLSQALPDARALPVPIPLRVALVGSTGLLPWPDGTQESLWMLDERTQTWVVEGLTEAPVLSLNRGFSAPIRLDQSLSDDDLARLMRVETEGFSRWMAQQRLAQRVLLAAESGIDGASRRAWLAALVDSFDALVVDDPALAARWLDLPPLSQLAEAQPGQDPLALYARREALQRAVAAALQDRWPKILAEGALAAPYTYTSAALSARALARVALSHAAWVLPELAQRVCDALLTSAPHMTAVQAALATWVHHQWPGADQKLTAFYTRWQHEPLVLDAWFALQASVPAAETLATADRLLAHPDYDATVPNRVRAVVATVAANVPAFHQVDGSGYVWFGQQVAQLDARNPQLASRLANAFASLRGFDVGRQRQVASVLDGLLAGDLSADSRETLSRLRAGLTSI